MDRRHLLKVIGIGGTAAAAGGCGSGGQERLIPYLIPVEDLQPGVSAEYSTVCRECPAGCGMIARVRDGRVHKVEGNPEHPLNRGTLCLRGQTALQDVYHPDRIRSPLLRNRFGQFEPISWEQAIARLVREVRELGDGRAAWIGRLDTGPFDRLVDQWLAAVAPTATRLRYEPFAYEPLREAHARVFGRPGVPDLRISEAGMLLSFGADFLETWVNNVQYSREFSVWRQRRLRGEHRGRYVFFAPRLSLTGANADQWIPIRPGAEALVARALTEVVHSERGGTAAAAGDVASLAEAAGVSAAGLVRLGREFAEESPSLAAPVGSAAVGEAATAANEAIARLNQAAGNVGRTYLIDWPHALETVSPHAEVAALIEAMHAGQIRLLFLHEANPVYQLPPALRVTEAIQRVPTVVSFSSYLDETTNLASLVLPDHRALESWGTYTPRPGVTGVMQPAIPPVFDTRQTGDVLLAAATELGRDLGAPDFRTYLRQALKLEESAWLTAVHRGGLFTAGARAPALDAGGRNLAVTSLGSDTAEAVPDGEAERSAEERSATAGYPEVPERSAPTGPPSGGVPGAVFAEDGSARLLLHLYPSLHLFDGRTANRPWAQEIPDPMTKAVWGSWAEIHPDTARRLNVEKDDLLRLTTGAGRLEAPALVTDRVRPEVVAIQLGQGHPHYTRFATGIGVNPMHLLTGEVERPSGALITSGVPVTVTRLPVQRKVVVLQASEQLEREDVARMTTLAELGRLPSGADGFAARDAERPTLRRYLPTGEHHWGMAIDLDRCIGCNACSAACYAENNVPIVGRNGCDQGREMSWLRIENYLPKDEGGGRKDHPFGVPGASGVAAPTAEPQDLQIRFLPMLCQQCNNAPCEYVCPVYATMHSDEGLNQQIYNRCVGTRYCSNNCPYKVRRFQWRDYEFPAPLDQQLNPDVITRAKGVMEKCTFCVQRIRRGTLDTKHAGEPLLDGRIMTACQQTCPTDAIVFGDLNDPHSRVRQLAADRRGYGVLGHLNTFPNITYLARVRAEPPE